MASIWDSSATYATNSPSTSTTWPSGGGGGSGGASSNPFYNTGGNYGQNQDWYNSPIGENIREDNQQLAFQSWAQRQGISNTDNTFNRWLYSTQFPRFQQAYGMATMDNPMLTIDQFLQTMPTYNTLLSEYNAMSPKARGSNQSDFAPNTRWAPR